MDKKHLSMPPFEAPAERHASRYETPTIVVLGDLAELTAYAVSIKV
jgi:hypothetical protein